jgi:hypothetical protein
MLDHVLDHSTGRTRPTSTAHRARRLLAIATVAAVATACSTSHPAPPPAPVETPTPTAEAPAAAALATYGEFWRISEQAFAAPNAQDWHAELSKVARGQALSDMTLEIRNYASVPAHLEGSVIHAPGSEPAEPSTADRVAILDCVDISNSRAVTDSNGTVIDDLKNRAERYHYRAQVVRDATGRWLVETTAPALDEPC